MDDTYKTSYSRSFKFVPPPEQFPPKILKHKTMKVMKNPEFSIYETTNQKNYKAPSEGDYNLSNFRQDDPEIREMYKTVGKPIGHIKMMSITKMDHSNEKYPVEFVESMVPAQNRIMEAAERMKAIKKQPIPKFMKTTYSIHHCEKKGLPTDVSETQYIESQRRGRGKRKPQKTITADDFEIDKSIGYRPKVVPGKFVTNIKSTCHDEHCEDALELKPEDYEKVERNIGDFSTIYTDSFSHRVNTGNDYSNDCFKRKVTLGKDKYGNSITTSKPPKKREVTFEEIYRLKTKNLKKSSI